MTITTIFFLLAGLAIAWVLFWRQWQEDEDVPDVEHDVRISPLLRGINYLLSDEPDRALQEMVEVAKLRSEAADVYMALGEMFRSQGEIGRAVRIHQNILARPDVSPDLYLQAHFALAKDFQTGGLLDRALRHYQKVLDVRSDHLGALTASLRIREQSSEWLKAEGLLSRIERLRGGEDSLHRAYLWAELAEDAMIAGKGNVAEDYVQKALGLASDCIHAYIVLVALALKSSKDDKKLRQAVMMMLEATPDHSPLLLPILLASKNDYTDILMDCWKQQNDSEFALGWLEEVLQEGVNAVVALRKKLAFMPENLRDSLRLTALGMNDDDDLVAQAKQWRLAMKHYHCAQCGVQIVEMRWQCPQCHVWGSMRAIAEDDV